MSGPPIIAVVGHTNTGKTSLLQTLSRQRDFGEVSPSGGTTERIERSSINDGQSLVATVLDTPGLEDSIGLRDALDAEPVDRREDGRSKLDRLMRSPEAAQRFAPEVEALRAAIEADVLLYTIDARDEPRPRHLDELAVLAMTARPLIPVLNFVARPEADVAGWREACARQGLHATVAFDAVVFDDTGERRLLESVRTLLPDFATSIDAWISLRARERVEAIRLAAEDAGDLLVDATAAVVVTNASALSREAALAQATESILESLRQAEAQTRTLICRRFGFEGKAAEATALDVAEALGGVDLLSQASLERAGLWAAGAGTGLLAAGAMVDLVLGRHHPGRFHGTRRSRRGTGCGGRERFKDRPAVARAGRGTAWQHCAGVARKTSGGNNHGSARTGPRGDRTVGCGPSGAQRSSVLRCDRNCAPPTQGAGSWKLERLQQTPRFGRGPDRARASRLNERDR